MRPAIKVKMSQSWTDGDYTLTFNNARGVRVTSIIRLEHLRDQTWGKTLAFCDVLMKGRALSHVRLMNGDSFHVSNELLAEAGI